MKHRYILWTLIILSSAVSCVGETNAEKKDNAGDEPKSLIASPKRDCHSPAKYAYRIFFSAFSAPESPHDTADYGATCVADLGPTKPAYAQQNHAMPQRADQK